MYRELGRSDVIYKFEMENINIDDDKVVLPEYEEVYEKIETAFDIDNEGYNIFLVDKFAIEKKENLMNYIEEILSKKDKPKDLCYLTYEDVIRPIPLYTSNGNGKVFVEKLESVQDTLLDLIFEFYNGIEIPEKEELLDNLSKEKNSLLNNLIESSKKEGFEIRPSDGGFAFLPLKEDKVMTDEEYDALDEEEKDKIVSKVNVLKTQTKEVLNKLRDIEDTQIGKIKKIMDQYLIDGMEEEKKDYQKLLEIDKECIEYLDNIIDKCIKELVENYSTDYDKDEAVINETLLKYKCKVVVDNSEYEHPRVIFEEDPSLSKLIGTIDLESSNGNYVSSVRSIKAGSLLKANQGCIVLRMSSLLNHSASYFYLKKCLLTSEVDLNYNKGYLELFSLGTIKPKTVKLDLKVILIGDYQTYEVLYNYDEDFRNIFKIRAESNPIVDINEDVKKNIMKSIVNICMENKLKPLTNEAVKEVAKYMSRKAESKDKVYFDSDDMKRLLILTSNYVRKQGEHSIDGKDIIKFAYPKEIIEKDILENYKENRVLISTEGKEIGKINGLSVIDLGYARFGKPIRITCSCYKGSGEIIDAQKAGELSGKIHNKAISILKGFINYLIGGYNEIPVDFHLSFEQIYGVVEGDSASVGEAVCMLSALSKLPIKQNMAVTGSINQFGEVQPIGGVNEKIEGFFKTCKLLGTFEGKGVIIPESNKKDLVLNAEVEREIEKGTFKIYTMSNITDALDLLMDSNGRGYRSVLEEIKKEIKKYQDKKK